MKKLAVLLFVVCALLLGGFLWIRSWLTPEYLRQQVETHAASAYQGRFTLGAIGYQFPLSVHLGDLVVADPTGKDEYLRVASASASLEPWALLSREVHVTRFVLGQPSLLVALDEKNQLEMLRYLELSGGDESSTSAGVALAVSEFRIEGAKVTLRQPGQPLRHVDPLDARLSLLGETLTIHELTVKALGSLQLEASGKITKLLQAPVFQDFAAKLRASMPEGFLDPTSHGQVGGEVDLTGNLAGSVTNPTATFQLRSQGIRWQAPDASLAPIETGPLQAQLKLANRALGIAGLDLSLWGGHVRGGGQVSASAQSLDLSVEAVKAGTWLGPMLTARGFGEPLPQLTVNAPKVHLDPASLSLSGLGITAGGLEVSGAFALFPRKSDGAWAFAPSSKLAGQFAGPDAVSALAIPQLDLVGDVGITMNFSGPTLAPTVKGDLESSSLKIGRPQVFSLPVTDLAGSFSYDGGALDVPGLTAKLLGGDLSANAGAQLDAVPPTYRFHLQGASFQVPEIFQTALVGSPFAKGFLDLNFDMKGAGTDPKALTGEGKAAIRTAQVAANPTLQLLADQLKSPEIAQPTLEGKFKLVEVRNGRFELGDFSGDNGKLGPVSGTGSIGFDQTLSGKVAWKVPLDSPEIPKEIRGKSLPLGLQLGGTLTAPEVKVDDVPKALGKMVEAELKAKLDAEKARALKKVEAKAQEKIGKVADKLLGKLGAQLGGGSSEGSDGQTDSAGSQDVKKKLENKLKGALRGLFR